MNRNDAAAQRQQQQKSGIDHALDQAEALARHRVISRFLMGVDGDDIMKFTRHGRAVGANVRDMPQREPGGKAKTQQQQGHKEGGE